MPRFRIQGLDKSVLGYVHGSNRGAALQAAVEQTLVTGLRKLFSATPLPENDPYEQTNADMFGAARKKSDPVFPRIRMPMHSLLPTFFVNA